MPQLHWYTMTNQSINQSVMFFRVVQVIKSLHDPLVVGNNLTGINDNVRETRPGTEIANLKLWHKSRHFLLPVVQS